MIERKPFKHQKNKTMDYYIVRIQAPNYNTNHLDDWSRKDIVYPKMDLDCLPENKNILFDFILEKKVKKLHDFALLGLLSVYGVVVSKKMKDILTKFRLPEHQFYPTIIQNTTNNNFIEDYYFMKVNRITIDNQLINFELSEFQSATMYGEILKEKVIFKNLDDYLFQKKHLKKKDFFEFTKLVLNTNDTGYDWFNIKYPQLSSNRFTAFISESLQREMLKSKIKEVDIIQASIRNEENIYWCPVIQCLSPTIPSI